MRPVLASIGLAVLLLSSVLLAAPPSAKAKEHTRRGLQLFDLGKYAEAAREHERAFELTDSAADLFYVAEAYRLAGMRQEASAAYRGVLRRDPESKQRAVVEAHLAAIDKAGPIAPTAGP